MRLEALKSMLQVAGTYINTADTNGEKNYFQQEDDNSDLRRDHHSNLMRIREEIAEIYNDIRTQLRPPIPRGQFPYTSRGPGGL